MWHYKQRKHQEVLIEWLCHPICMLYHNFAFLLNKWEWRMERLLSRRRGWQLFLLLDADTSPSTGPDRPRWRKNSEANMIYCQLNLIKADFQEKHRFGKLSQTFYICTVMSFSYFSGFKCGIWESGILYFVQRKWNMAWGQHIYSIRRSFWDMLFIEGIHPKNWTPWITESADHFEFHVEILSENAKTIKITLFAELRLPFPPNYVRHCLHFR